ncbi:MAG: hypothetical protein GJ680_18060 [Alteromonadaceae bacterium]|nr:hypothetical protein [Alteromonadaceae bacterium]
MVDVQIKNFILDFIQYALEHADEQSNIMATLLMSLEGESSFRLSSLGVLNETHRIKANTIIAHYLITDQRPSACLDDHNLKGTDFIKALVDKYGMPRFTQRKE